MSGFAQALDVLDANPLPQVLLVTPRDGLGETEPSALAMLKAHAHRPERLAQVQQAFKSPSLYDESLRLLVRKGFVLTDTERDWSEPRNFNQSAESAWLTVYRKPEAYWDLYQLAEELVDLEDAFRQWRYRHVTTVERIIGFKPGTGGTNGVPYLRRQLDTVLFAELWKVRTDL